MVIQGQSVEKISLEIAGHSVVSQRNVARAARCVSLTLLLLQVTQIAAKGFCTIDPKLDDEMLRLAREDECSSQAIMQEAFNIFQYIENAELI